LALLLWREDNAADRVKILQSSVLGKDAISWEVFYIFGQETKKMRSISIAPHLLFIKQKKSC